MKQITPIVTILAVALIACESNGEPRKLQGKPGQRQGNGPSPSLAGRLFQTPQAIKLSEEQKPQVQALIVEYEPKLKQFQTAILKTLTKDQREARAAAFRHSRKDPKNGKEIRDASVATIELPEEKKRQFSKIREEKSRIKREALQKFHALLTAEQRKIISDQQGSRKSRPLR